MRGRKARTIPRVGFKLRLRQDLLAQLDLILLNPSTQKVTYGKRADLIEGLIQRWITEQVQGAQGATTLDLHKARIALGMLRSGNITDLPAATKLLAEALGESA